MDSGSSELLEPENEIEQPLCWLRQSLTPWRWEFSFSPDPPQLIDSRLDFAAPGLDQEKDVRIFTAQMQDGIKTVLVVEDEEALRSVMSIVLQRSGYRVLTAGDVQAARSLMESNNGRLDLLITDVTLPGKQNGLQLARELQAMNPTLPIIVASGNDPASHQEARSSLSSCLSLAKPFTLAALLKAVNASVAP